MKEIRLTSAKGDWRWGAGSKEGGCLLCRMKYETEERMKGDELRQDSDEPKEQGIRIRKKLRRF